MVRRNIVQYVCACAFLVFIYLQMGNSEEVGDVERSEHIPQSSKEVIIREDAEEALYNAGLKNSVDLDIRCPVPESPENGYIKGEFIHVGSILYLRCYDGYSVEGPTEKSCVLDKYGAHWKPDVRTVCMENDIIRQQTSDTKSLASEQEIEPKLSDTNSVISPPSYHQENILSPVRKNIPLEEPIIKKEVFFKQAMEVRNKFPSLCLYKPDTGPCGASHKRYYFSKTTMECYKFIYGGCDGNHNNFQTITECNLACLGHQ
uniref:BPTI/Kunitz inhibitor domain-containing protein n=1 Tax=Arion vulgaris TaxID=1028688 RepID=A0A0B6Y9P0_9EUPU